MAVTASYREQFRHLALFYHGRGEYLAALAGFIQASQARGNAVFVAVPKGNAQLVHQEFGVNSTATACGSSTRCDLVQARTGPAGTTIRLHMRLNGHSPRRHLSRQTH